MDGRGVVLAVVRLIVLVDFQLAGFGIVERSDTVFAGLEIGWQVERASV